MIQFQAELMDGKTAEVHVVQVLFSGQQLEITGAEIRITLPISRMRIEPVLGRTDRVLKFRTGEKLVSRDFAAIAQLEDTLGINKGMTLVNRLEQSWRLVLISFVGLVLVTFAFVRFGVPWIAKQAAFATPVSVLKTITDSAFSSIDGQLLQKSRLSQKRQAELQAIFARVTKQIGQNYPYKLELRRGASIGANAFALPSGTIVLTDELVNLSQVDLELEAVLAHEVGHVIQRHGTRNLYQGLGLVLLAGVFIGDFSSVAGLGSSLPVLLLQNGYSQEFEFESDQVAGRYLLQITGSTKAMQDILKRLEQSRPQQSESGMNILRTHPITPERVKALELVK